MKAIKKIVIAVAVAVVIISSALFIYVDMESARVVPVLMYHSFQVEKDSYIPYVSPRVFEKQMEFLAAHRYNVVAPDKIVDYMTGKEKQPPRTVAITADDGYMSFYENAYPVLKRYNLPATIFVIADNIGKPGYMGWKELREMSGSGLITIGSHTKTHPWMPSVSVDESALREEVVVSKDILEKGLGVKVGYICYPNGGFNEAVKEAVEKAGYRGAFTTNPTRASDIGDIYAIRRIKMSSSSVSPLNLWGKISRYYVWFKERR